MSQNSITRSVLLIQQCRRLRVEGYTSILYASIPAFTHPLQSKCANHIFSKRLNLHERDLEVPVQLCIIGPVFEALDLLTRRDHHLGPNVTSAETITRCSVRSHCSFMALKTIAELNKLNLTMETFFSFICANKRDTNSIHVFLYNELALYCGLN